MVWPQHAIPYPPPLVAFKDMQEKTATQFCHHETAGETTIVAIYDMRKNTSAIFLLHHEYRRGVLTNELMYEKGFASYQTA